MRKPPNLCWCSLPRIKVKSEGVGTRSAIGVLKSSFESVEEIHKIPLQQIRKALRYASKSLRVKRPLLDNSFRTDGASLFIGKYGELVNLSRQGQLEMEGLIRAYLKRFDYDATGVRRLYPFVRSGRPDEPKIVAIDPEVAFGKPSIADSGISTLAITQRYKAGESIHDLAKDYGIKPHAIEEAVRCELRLQAA